MKTVIILDMDNTIFDTEKFWIDVKKITEKDSSDEFTDSDIKKLKQKITEDYLFVDARRFISCHENIVILSVGNESRQKLKMVFIKFDLPLFVLSKHRKSEWIKENLLREGEYIINGQTFESIIFCDDKEENFEGFGGLPNAHGYLVNRYGKEHGELPSNVVEITSFDQIV